MRGLAVEDCGGLSNIEMGVQLFTCLKYKIAYPSILPLLLRGIRER